MQVCHTLSAAEPLETNSLADGWYDSTTAVDRGELLGGLKRYRYV